MIILLDGLLDWQFESAHSLWQNHSFTTNIITGALLLFLGLFGVDFWYREREARKWQHVASISCKELGYSCDVLNNGVEHLLTGHFRSKHGVFLNNELERTIEQRLRQFDLYSPDQHHLPFEERARRLDVLLDHHEWADHAEQVLDHLKHLHRDKIASWMPVMLMTDESVRALNSVAELNESIFRLQGPLRKLARPMGYHADLPPMEKPKKEALQRWDEVITKAVKAQESLMRMAGEKGWVHAAGRHRLSAEGSKQVETTN